jgi:hypothetical protein
LAAETRSFAPLGLGLDLKELTNAPAGYRDWRVEHCSAPAIEAGDPL